jgi:hypothetical protein
VLIAEGTFINIYENSETTLEKLRLHGGERDFSFKFIKGRILWMAAKIKRKVSRFEVKTPSAVCAVRGTDFTIDLASATADIGLFDGEMAIRAGGTETPLAAGSEAVAGEDVKVSGKFSRLMEVEKRRYLKLRKRAEELRAKLAARDNFIQEHVQARQKKLQDMEQRRRKKLDTRK